jgi:hypothetical protein
MFNRRERCTGNRFHEAQSIPTTRGKSAAQNQERGEIEQEAGKTGRSELDPLHRYDKLGITFFAMVCFAALLIWLL